MDLREEIAAEYDAAELAFELAFELAGEASRDMEEALRILARALSPEMVEVCKQELKEVSSPTDHGVARQRAKAQRDLLAELREEVRLAEEEAVRTWREFQRADRVFKRARRAKLEERARRAKLEEKARGESGGT